MSTLYIHAITSLNDGVIISGSKIDYDTAILYGQFRERVKKDICLEFGDADNDGIGDTCDACAFTSNGVTVDDNGCSSIQITPSQPQLVNPGIDTVNVIPSNINFTWNPSTDPDAAAGEILQYCLIVKKQGATDAVFNGCAGVDLFSNSNLVPIFLSDTSYLLPITLDEGSRYIWTVRAKDVHANISELPVESTWRSFTTATDSDHDGVYDHIDLCAGSNPFDDVDAFGCSASDLLNIDNDGDGCTENQGDTDDTNPAIGGPSLWYRDADGDGHGSQSVAISACAQPDGYVADKTDCNDANANITHHAAETCGDNTDNNCDGQVDEGCVVVQTPTILSADYDPDRCWNYIDWNDVGAAQYKMYWGTSSGVTTGSNLATPTTTTDYGHTGVVPGWTYYYRIMAVSANGQESALSAEVAVTVPADTVQNCGRPLPDTGQTQCYDNSTAMTCPSAGQAFYGQDAQYTTNPMSYINNNNGTVTDNVTGLMWQREDDNVTRTWANAVSYCEDSTLAGYTDWRLPSKKELMSIVNYGRYNPAIDTTAFPGTNSSHYWSSTPYADDTYDAWYVGFDGGGVYGYYKTYSFYARCVRGEELPDNNFTYNRNGTVTDNDTGLEWQQATVYHGNWQGALAYCENLTFPSGGGGYTDWRLPDIKELESITDDSWYNPAIDTTAFPGTISSGYWSGTTGAGDTKYAWYANFYDGHVYVSYAKTNYYYARCVRGGQ